MYPYEIAFGIDLYTICLSLGVVAAMLVFRLYADRKQFSSKITNLVLMDIFISVVAGYFSAVLAQGIYNALETGTFELTNSTGATFLGGLIGGTAVFIAIFLPFGKLWAKESRLKSVFLDITSIAGACISIAHCIGRIGCFFAGCCYGKETESFLGIKFPGMENKVLPTQLFESGFLLTLFVVLLILNMKKDNFVFGLPVYMMAYGSWRFFIEYLRGDDRGASPVSFLSPSQLTSVCLVTGGIIMFCGLVCSRKRKKNEETA